MCVNRTVLFTACITVLLAATGFSQTPVIKPDVILPAGETALSLNDTFTVKIVVGDALTPVNHLYGISFVLNYDTRVVEAQEALAGDFLGAGILFYPSLETGTVSLGMSAKSGDGATGSGTVALVRFKVSGAATAGARAVFTLSSVVANDNAGTAIVFTAGTDSLLVGGGTQPPAGGTPPLAPEAVLPGGKTSVSPGDTFTVRIIAGNALSPVNRLYGLSFVLSYDTQVLEALEAVAGDFLGAGILFYPALETGTVSVGMSAKSGDGATGSGVVAQIRFKVSGLAATGITTDLTLGNLVANDNLGTAISFIPGTVGISIEKSSGATGVLCDFNKDGKKNVTDVIALLIFQRAHPGDLGGDFNRDNRSNISDAIAMLLAQRNSTCPDRLGAALSSALDENRFLEKIEDLTKGDIEHLESILEKLGLTSEEETAFKLALYGRTGRAELPRSFSLEQNTPNPFNPATTIAYSVPEGKSKLVTLKVYDLRGRLVCTLIEGTKEAGTYRVFWDGTDEAGRRVTSGIYLYRMQAGAFVQTRKMVLLK